MILFNVITTITTILLSVVAIRIAIYSSRKTSQEATRQIEEMKNLTQQTIENTAKEVESIKELAKLQIEATKKQVELEIKKAQLWAKQASEEAEGIEKIQKDHFIQMAGIHDKSMQKYNEDKPKRDYIRYREFIHGLDEILNELKKL